MIHQPEKMLDWPTWDEAVDKALSTENLTEIASKTTDPQTLLGIAFLARAGSPVRREIGEAAVKGKPEYAPILPVLAVTMDGVDEGSLGDLLRRDPDNALGYYLQGSQFYRDGKEDHALESFRKAAHCSELRLYETTTGEALFKALDALNLRGRERLCALSWMESRVSQFRGIHLQPLCTALSELAQPAPRPVREEISELLIILAGQFFVTNFQNRWFATHALGVAFGLKADLSATESPARMHGYAATNYALCSEFCYWPGLDEEMKEKPLQLARHLPSRIHRSFAMVDPSKRQMLGELKLNPPESDRLAFENAMEELVKAAQALLELALTDPDGILGPYLKGIPPRQKQPVRPWFPQSTPVVGLMHRRPDVFRAAAAYQKAEHALRKAGENDPEWRNKVRMMEIGQALHWYATEHEQTFPDSIGVLFEQGYLKPPFEARSLLTGRPYVFAAAGEKQPTKRIDSSRRILLYDDQADECGGYPCVFASGVGSSICGDELEEQLRKEGNA